MSFIKLDIESYNQFLDQARNLLNFQCHHQVSYQLLEQLGVPLGDQLDYQLDEQLQTQLETGLDIYLKDRSTASLVRPLDWLPERFYDWGNENLCGRLRDQLVNQLLGRSGTYRRLRERCDQIWVRFGGPLSQLEGAIR